ncbi:MAG: hypothetical protein ACKVU2_06650 [Saprospiraceae bacterium]
MTEHEILAHYLNTIYDSQSEMCMALNLDKKSQPRFSQAFKGEKHSFALIVRICEEKRVLSRFFLQGMAQIFQKKDEEIIALRKKLIEKNCEVDRITSLFQAFMLKFQSDDHAEPARNTAH